MHFIVTLLSTLAGVIFAIGAPARASVQEVRAGGLGTVVIARQNGSMDSGWYDSERSRFLTVLAASKDHGIQNADTRSRSKSSDSKPSRKPRSPKTTGRTR